MLSRSFAKLAFYIVAVVLVSWTATLTYSFVASALPNLHWMVPLFSLIAFDGGMIAWLFVFLHFAEGSFQRAIAIGACVIDLIGVGLMVIAEIFLGGQTMVAAPESLGDMALWGVGIWTVINVAAVIAFHLTDPQARQKMKLQEQRDKIFDQALTKLGEQVDADAGRLAATLAGRNFSALLQELSMDGNNDGIPDILQRTTPRPSTNGTPARVAAEGQPAPAIRRLASDGEWSDVPFVETADRLRKVATQQRDYAETNERLADEIDDTEVSPPPTRPQQPGR